VGVRRALFAPLGFHVGLFSSVQFPDPPTVEVAFSGPDTRSRLGPLELVEREPGRLALLLDLLGRASADTQLHVQPILTPDNYAAHVVDLIESAHDYTYFHNQSLSVLDDNPDHYENLLQALLHKQQAGLDVRIIIRKIGDLRKTVSRIRDYGFDTDQQLRVQTNCHTKGVIVDGKAVLIGSQNWTGDGTGLNRDATSSSTTPKSRTTTNSSSSTTGTASEHRRSTNRSPPPSSPTRQRSRPDREWSSCPSIPGEANSRNEALSGVGR
jgi:phosphatidylserine/phosphatidylglycerophosphate/cardiolipin synthase-like enzyme